ncbi:hypothetical protein ABT065_47290, partial [Streptomyces sp. NPDC002764]
RQATTHTLGHTTLPHTLTSQFLHYVELDTPCLIEATVTDTTSQATHDEEARTVHVTARQNATTVFRCTLTTPPPHH